jgi:N-acetylglutamate synthase-like GNAT family acetyltransferase
MARLHEHIYDSDVVGKSGAGMERSTATVSVPWPAGAGLECVRMLPARRKGGDAEQARELLNRALATARGLGLAKVDPDAAGLLK